ncbi:MAG: outer membrane beta-barrel protein [Pseudomonadota bacterium]
MKMGNVSRLGLALAMVVAGEAALATDVSYDFVELRFIDTEIDDANVDGDGFQISGSYNISGNWLIVGGYTSLDFDGPVEGSLLEAGGGYVWPVDPKFDLFSTISIARAEVDVGSFSDDETGFRIVGGIRTKFTDQFEGRAELNYLDIDDSDTLIRLGGDYYFTPQFAGGATIDLGGDNDQITFGIRYFFGDRRVRNVN